MGKILPMLAMLLLVQAILFLALSDSRPFYDEGIYLTGSWLYSQGTMPYSGFFESKPIGIFATGALLFSLLPSILLSARMLMLLIGLVSTALVFLIAKKTFDEKTALASAVFFVFLSVVFGNFWFVIEPFVAFLALLSVFCYVTFLEKESKKWLALANLFAVSTVLFKQTAILIAVFFILFFLYREMKRQKPFINGLVSFLPSLIPAVLLAIGVIAFLLYTNAWGFFYNYLFAFHTTNLGHYARVILSLDFLPFAVSIIIPVLLFLFLKKTFFDSKQKILLLLLLAWLLGSSAMILPLLGCCMHFVPILPALSILSGIGFWVLWKKHLLLKLLALLVMIAVIFGGLYYAFAFSQPEHGFAGLNSLAKKIQTGSGSEDRILVLPASPELYFLSERRPATKALFFYLADYPEQFIEEELQRLESANPRYVVVFSADGEFTSTVSPKIDSFVLENFELRETIELPYPLYLHYKYALIFEN